MKDIDFLAPSMKIEAVLESTLTSDVLLSRRFEFCIVPLQ
jgi:hypothetical protein